MANLFRCTGGNNDKYKSKLEVTIPDGSTVTATKNGIIYTPSLSVGNVYTFYLETGEYEITATDGTNSKTENILIDVPFEIYTLEIVYMLKVYWLGDLCEDVSGDFEFYKNKENISLVKNSDHLYISSTGTMYGYGIQTKNQIDTRQYTKVNIEWECSTLTYTNESFICGYTDDGTQNRIFRNKANGDTMINGKHIDSLTLSDNHGYEYVKIEGFNVKHKIYRIWFE